MCGPRLRTQTTQQSPMILVAVRKEKKSAKATIPSARYSEGLAEGFVAVRKQLWKAYNSNSLRERFLELLLGLRIDDRIGHGDILLCRRRLGRSS